MTKRKVLLGVSGSIAAYKTPELIRQLLSAGYEVKVALTESAKAFVTPLTLETLLPQAVFQTLLEPQMQHIELAKWTGSILIAPATAHTIAKLAHGLADDLISNICLASNAPLVIAPAMNQAMWQHPATQANIELLKQRSAHFIGPDCGIQACGDTGPGRMLEPDEIIAQLSLLTVDKFLTGKRILITAGPTYEMIDPVRYIANRSSGKMGYALAEAATDAGAEVTLISGPVAIPKPNCHKIIDVKSARDMLLAVEAEIIGQDIFIAAAAVADYEVETKPQKIKGNDAALHLTLKPTVDILATIGKRKDKLFLVGFAAETENIAENAKAKLIKKNADMIIANDVSRKDIGFESDDNEIIIFTKDKIIPLKKAPKTQIAMAILKLFGEQLIDTFG